MPLQGVVLLKMLFFAMSSSLAKPRSFWSRISHTSESESSRNRAYPHLPSLPLTTIFPGVLRLPPVHSFSSIIPKLKMFGRGLFSWFSSKNDEPAFHAWNAQTASIQNQQPSSPSAPSLEDAMNEQTVRDADPFILRERTQVL